MNIYDRWLLPYLIDLAMRYKEVTRYRGRIVPQARDTVLEIGIGSGLNLPFYGASVERVLALDPSPQLLRMARRRAAQVAFPVDFLAESGEDIPLPDRSVDTVVSTWTLCSIPDPALALREIGRVLKPGGRFLFAEHGYAPDPSVAAWQRRLNPIWGRLAGGCHLDRKVDDLIRTAGFRLEEIEMGYARGPRPVSYMYVGCARFRSPAANGHAI